MIRVSTSVELFPIFPSRVRPNIWVGVLLPSAERPGLGAAACSTVLVARCHGFGHAAPAYAEAVVGSSFVRVREDAVGGDDQSVSFEFDCVGDIAAWVGAWQRFWRGSGTAAVGVVQLD